MSIEIRRASKIVVAKRRKRRLVRDFSIRVMPGDRVALMSTSTSEKDVALEILGASMLPDTGSVSFTGRVSWPLPSIKFLSIIHSAATNIRFVARLHEVDGERLLSRVSAMTGCGDAINFPLKKWPAMKRMELGYALGACIKFDTYLFDEHPVLGSEAFQEKCRNFLNSLRPHQSYLVATRSEDVVREFCKTAYILDKGKTTYFRSVGAAIRAFRGLSKDVAKANEDQEEAEFIEVEDDF